MISGPTSSDTVCLPKVSCRHFNDLRLGLLKSILTGINSGAVINIAVLHRDRR